MTAGPIDVAFCFDDHLALPGAVAILSLLATNPRVRIHVVTDPRPDAAPLLRSIARESGADLRIIDAAPERDHGVDSASDYGRESTATYRRVFLSELLPDLNRVIYLDADLIVRGSLDDLWGTDLAGLPAGAVADPWMITIDSMRAAFPQGYFNAGMLLIDLERWREERVPGRFVADIRRRQRDGEDPLGHRSDQTPLNEVLRGRWRPLSPRWNFTGYHVPQLAEELGLPDGAFAGIAADPAIVHFLGSHKPWVPGFASLTSWHREWQALRDRLEAKFDLSGLAWPSSFTNGDAAARRRRMIAMKLVQRAREGGLEEAAVVLTGLLGHEVLQVAREQGVRIGCLASENPAYSGGRLHDVEVVTIGEAIEQGRRDFILADYRRLGRTRDLVLAEAERRGAELRLVAVDA